MLKEIPQKANHIVKGFNEIKPCKDNLLILYEPIYERIFPLNEVYWDHARNERIYLTSDTEGITCAGQFVEVETRQLGHLDTADREMFFELLAHNGYKIKDGKLEFHPNYGDLLATEDDLIVIYLPDGYHTVTNTIVKCVPIRYASMMETQLFFTQLDHNSFRFNPALNQITAVEKYYYFASYSLKNGFRPERKKWINSDTDKFYEQHYEVFDTYEECASFCNMVNHVLKRNYPEY